MKNQGEIHAIPETQTASCCAPLLPSFDVHEQDGELVLHAELGGAVELVLEGADLVVQTNGGKGRLPLPFEPGRLQAVSRPGCGDLEIHVSELDLAVG